MWVRIAWLFPVAMSAVVYYPITRNYFFSDDFLHFWQIVNDGVGHFILRMHGGHMYLARNVILAAMFSLFGMHASPYFHIALLTHLLNVSLLYCLIYRMTLSWRIACISAALWGMAPVDEGAVGWISVFGHVVAGTCTLLVLIGLAGSRTDPSASSWRPGLWSLLTAVGSTCFGVGIGIAFAMPGVAWLLLRPGRQRRVGVIAFAVTAAAVVGLYFSQAWLYKWLYGEATLANSFSDLDPSYWPSQTAFLFALLGYGIAAVLLGAVAYHVAAAEVVIVPIVAAATAVAVWRAPQRMVRPLLACLLLAIGVYGMISLGRAWSAPVSTARYHYLGGMIVAIALGLVLDGLTTGTRVPPWCRNGAVAAWATLALYVAVRLGPPINHFNFARHETESTLAAITAIAASAPPGADVYILNRPFHSIFFVPDLTYFPGWAAVFAMFHPDDMLDGHRIYFSVPSGEGHDDRAKGRQATALLRPGTADDRGASNP